MGTLFFFLSKSLNRLNREIRALIVALIRWIIGVVDLFSYDRTWIAGLAWLWSILEVNTGLICGCTMVLRPLLRRKEKSEANEIWMNQQKKAPQPTFRQMLDKTETDQTETDSEGRGDLLSSMNREWRARGWAEPSSAV